jgi:hypothetical protein
VESEKLVGRILTCGWCSSVVVLCQECDYGSRYCSDICAQQGRGRSLRLAGARYQRTFTGAQKHAARQAAYRIRQEQKVTHHSFSADGSSVIVEEAEREVSRPSETQLEMPVTLQCCINCGRSCVFIVRERKWPLLHERIHQRQGEKYDSW